MEPYMHIFVFIENNTYMQKAYFGICIIVFIKNSTFTLKTYIIYVCGK